MTPALRAALYARFSTDLQRDASIEDQIRSCREHAARQGLEVVEVYSDRAVSGASLMRSGIQKLLRDAQGGGFDVVIAEALDRLSRNQADIATIYQRLQFNGQVIETLSEGQVSEMHIGLAGTMNALFLKELGRKTHRGLKGRALAGKSAGGLTYGYKAVTRHSDDGEPIRGDRAINPDQAAVVRRIFAEYAKGLSPRKIAETLNVEKVPGPQGGAWGTSTIHGNRERGTGILNNELYIGRQVLNRLRYVKDPSTGKRVSRLNPEAEWVITDVPQLRIIDQNLWQAARERQGALKTKATDIPVWDRRRPKFLFSGLMTCGCCGAGFSKVSKDSFGCSAARNKGAAVCTNMTTIRRADLEGAVLEALEHHLMDDEVVWIFCEEYATEHNRLRAEADAGRADLEKELRQVTADHKKLVDAIIAGVPAEQVKDRMIELDRRRKELDVTLSSAPAPDPVRFHPSMARIYLSRVGQLVRGLTMKNSERLGQLHDHQNVIRLLALPEVLLQQAMERPTAATSPLRAMFAVAICILLACPMRMKNLASLDIEKHLSVHGTGARRLYYIRIDAQDVKNGVPIEVTLSRCNSEMLRVYLEQFRHRLSERPSTALFPRKGDGKPRAEVNLGQAISAEVLRHTGLEINPHLFRHIAAYLYLKERPGDFETVRRLLKHRKLQSTMQFYAELSSQWAHEHYDAVVLSKWGSRDA